MSFIPYGIVQLFQTFGATRENRIAMNENLKALADALTSANATITALGYQATVELGDSDSGTQDFVLTLLDGQGEVIADNQMVRVFFLTGAGDFLTEAHHLVNTDGLVAKMVGGIDDEVIFDITTSAGVAHLQVQCIAGFTGTFNVVLPDGRMVTSDEFVVAAGGG